MGNEVTGQSALPYTTKLAGEALLSASIGAVKISDGKIWKGADSGGLIGAGVVQSAVSAGDSVTLDKQCYWVKNSSVTAVDADDIGKICYVEDEYTVCETSTISAGLIAGRVEDVSSAKGVLVNFNIKVADTISAT